MSRIRISILKIIGINKDYIIKFKDGLNIIAGEISTGKTSILDLIDYCLGKRDSPSYPELLRNGRTALLEIEVNSEIITIERPLFSQSNTAFIHNCSIHDLKNEHKVEDIKATQIKNQVSISSYLLSKLGLDDIPLKEAPTQASSGVDTMSFRDLMFICYLRYDRISGLNLLFEKTPQKYIKLRQVVDVIFDLHSDILAKMAEEYKLLQENLEEVIQKEKTLNNFINEQRIPTIDELEEERENLFDDVNKTKGKLNSIDMTISNSSEIGKEVRNEVLRLNEKLQSNRTDQRSYKKTLNKLMPLRGQYNEDISKLNFLHNAKQIIDPLSIVLCPVCFSKIEVKESIKTCKLCGNEIKHVESDVEIDVSKEIKTIKRKMNELNKYVEELDLRLSEKEKEEKELLINMELNNRKLDEELKNYVSPFLRERDLLVSSISKNENELSHIDELINIRNSIENIINAKKKLNNNIIHIEQKIEQERDKIVNRKVIMRLMNEDFNKHLETVHFPKLSDAYFNDKLMPYIRGTRYDKLSSTGAVSLASICWITSIYEVALKNSDYHPRFLMLDNIQSGIGVGAELDRDFKDENIIKGVYNLLLQLADSSISNQIIIVDNHPPNEVGHHVIVRFSRDPERPPYGLIDDDISD